MAVDGPILTSARERAEAVRSACIDVYEPLLPGRSCLFFPDHELEALIADRLLGVELSGPIRRRSKLAKVLVATALGYGAPTSFKKTTPRFPGQDLDVYVQTSDNLQIWNEEISPERRYVLLRPQENGIVSAVRVVRGQRVARWDTTGTLTSKYQARRPAGAEGSKIVSAVDTQILIREFSPGGVPIESLALLGSSQAPQPGSVLSIAHLYEQLLSLIGYRLAEVGAEQDRTRGELLQEAVCSLLGLRGHENYAQWPDIVCQALEVKLQTSPTIDLGLVLPTDTGPAYALGPRIRHCDARYLIAYGELNDQGATTITDIVVTTGMEFFREFQQFGGLVQNKKRQIKLPQGLFESQ